jgi:hypothetical protein
MSRRGATASLKDILEAVDRIQRYVAGLSEAEFLDNTEKQDAVIRNLEVIGEAVRNIPADMRRKHKEIEWTLIAGTRDKLIHHYFGVNWEIVWNVVQEKLPSLQADIQRILADQAPES